MESADLCGHCGKAPSSTRNTVRCQACLTTFCGPSCQASAAKKHKSECHDLAVKAFHRCVKERKQMSSKQWAEDMMALSWSMRKESEALYPPADTKEPVVIEDAEGTEVSVRLPNRSIPRVMHFLALYHYMEEAEEEEGAFVPVNRRIEHPLLHYITRAFDGFPEWPTEHANDSFSTSVQELHRRAPLLLKLAKCGKTKQAMAIGQARMVPAIRQLERQGVCRDEAGVLQLMRLYWSEILLTHAYISRAEDTARLIQEATSMALTCLRELEALPRLVDEEEGGSGIKSLLIESASCITKVSCMLHAYALSARMGRWVMQYGSPDMAVLESVVEALVVLKAVDEAEAVLQEAVAGMSCAVDRGSWLVMYYKIAVCSPSSHERALALMSQALADLPPTPPPSSPPLPPVGDEEVEMEECELCESEHLSARAVRLRLLLACGYVSDCLGRAEECQEYDRQARVICPNTIEEIDTEADETGRICDMNLLIREGKRLFRSNDSDSLAAGAFRLVTALMMGPPSEALINSAAKSEAWALLGASMGHVTGKTRQIMEIAKTVKAQEEAKYEAALREVRRQIGCTRPPSTGDAQEKMPDLGEWLSSAPTRGKARGKKHKKASKKHKKKSKSVKGGAAAAKEQEEAEEEATSKAEEEEEGRNEEEVVQTEEQQEEADDECCICLLELKREERLAEEEGVQRRLACSHGFHSSCLVLWLSKCEEKGLAASCPMCRQAV